MSLSAYLQTSILDFFGSVSTIIANQFCQMDMETEMDMEVDMDTKIESQESKLARPLAVPQKIDESDGDSGPSPKVTKEQLDRELDDMYIQRQEAYLAKQFKKLTL